MSILQSIQESLISNEPNLGSILMKLRLLAARLDSDILEEWVKNELSGYPIDVELPEYRILAISFKGTFSGPFGSGMQNAPIPSALVRQYAGDKWTNRQVREGISTIDDLVKAAQESGSIGMDCSNLILLLQGKVYEDYACNDIRGTISRSSLVQIQNQVKSRILEFTIELEKTIPSASEIAITPSKIKNIDNKEVLNIVNQTIYGNYTSITNSGDGAQIGVQVIQGNLEGFKKVLEQAGISTESAIELSEIIKNEKPTSPTEPLGERANRWLLNNLEKAIDGTWKVGFAVATEVITKAAMQYYGL